MCQRDNISGLGKEIDLLKDRHALAFNKIAKQAWQTAVKAINNHRARICKSHGELQILDTSRKTTDAVADTVVEKVFSTTSLDAILDLRSDSLKQFADATPQQQVCLHLKDRIFGQNRILLYLQKRSLAGSSGSAKYSWTISGVYFSLILSFSMMQSQAEAVSGLHPNGKVETGIDIPESRRLYFQELQPPD